MRRQIKWTVCAFAALALILLGIYVFYIATRCSENGVARDDAKKIATEQLKLKFSKNALSNDFILEKEEFDAVDKSWIFTYRARDCTVAIIIDKCGVADVGGMSEGCLPTRER